MAKPTKPTERRVRRTEDTPTALSYQLDACRSRSGITAMVVADEEGNLLAASGDRFVCEEVAGRVVIAGRRIQEFHGTLLSPEQHFDVQMRKIEIDGAPLMVCAVGGNAAARNAEISRGADGARRILALAA